MSGSMNFGRFFDKVGVFDEVFDNLSATFRRSECFRRSFDEVLDEVSTQMDRESETKDQHPRTKDREPRTRTISSRRLDAKRHYVILSKALDGIWPVGHGCAVLC